MKKLLMIAPHLSTGGMPQYLCKQIESLKGEYEIHCIEWDSITGGVLVVQRNKIHEMIGDNLLTLGEDKEAAMRHIEAIRPDVIHFQEVPETFVPDDILRKIYRDDREWKIVVTTHSSHTNPASMRYGADRFVLVSGWSWRKFAGHFGTEICSVWEYPMVRKDYDKEAAKAKMGFDPNVKHVLHVGLFTPGKNQAQLFEIAKRMPDVMFHFVGNQADNFRSYWEPLMAAKPDNCIWHGERHNVDDYYKAADVFVFPSLFELNPLSLIEAETYGLRIAMRNLETYDGKYDGRAFYFDDDNSLADQTIRGALETPMQNRLYHELPMNYDVIRKVDPIIECNFIEGPYVSISNAYGDEFDAVFTDEATGMVHYTVTLGNGHWSRCVVKYVKKWIIKITRKSDGKVFERRYDPRDKRVFVTLESRSLGDTLAWFPQVVQYAKETGAKVVCSTFWNELLKEGHPEIELVEPGTVVHGIYAMHSIGWFYDEKGNFNWTTNPRDFRKLPLGETAADILGIEFKHRRANIVRKKAPIHYNRIGLGFHSTAQAKYWNNPDGWDELVDFFSTIGMQSMVISHEGDGWMGNAHPKGSVMLEPGGIWELIDVLRGLKLFVGLGSGLSWLAWTLGVPTVVISGFSEPYSEFDGDDVVRVGSAAECGGCYNSHRLDAGDWNWCPLHKGTDRQFECTKSITAKMVIEKIREKGLISIKVGK